MYQDIHQDYSGFLTEVLRKYILLFGPDIVHEIASHIPTIKLLPDGTVAHLDSDPLPAVRDILAQLHMLSDVVYTEITLQIMNSYAGMPEAIHPHLETGATKTHTAEAIHGR